MTQTQINGGTQIRSGTITTTQISSTAAIADGQLASAYLLANGTRTSTASQNFGGFEALNAATPTLSTSLATKGYVDGAVQGLSSKYSARAATTGSETFTIASGSVTQISGTTLDGQSPAVGEYVLVKDAPSASGTGSPGSSQPANGLYSVTSNTTNLSLSRATDMSGSISPAGAYVFVEAGTANVGSGWVVTTPSTNAAFTYGTGSVAWTQFSGAGEISTDSTLSKTGNQLSRAAITGDVSIASGSNSSTIGAGAVTLSKMAALAANSVIANTTGSSATPAALGITASPTASTAVLRDSNGNTAANAFVPGVTTTATAAGTTTLVASSTQMQQFTGTTTQTVVMPNATTLANGRVFFVANRSTGAVTVNDGSSNPLQVTAAGSQLQLTLVSNATTAGVWDVAYLFSGGSGSVTTVSVASANGFAGTVANASSTPAITLSTSVTGILKGNGTAVSAAAAGTDYMAPSDFVTRETPSGSINGSNTAFTLANTPISGTEMLFYNGLLQEPGGQDYSITGSAITFVTAPVSGDRIRCSYQK